MPLSPQIVGSAARSITFARKAGILPVDTTLPSTVSRYSRAGTDRSDMDTRSARTFDVFWTASASLTVVSTPRIENRSSSRYLRSVDHSSRRMNAVNGSRTACPIDLKLARSTRGGERGIGADPADQSFDTGVH